MGQVYVPAAFLRAVNILAFTTALTPPECLSKLILAGVPFSLISFGAFAEGLERRFMVVLTNDSDGMNSVVRCSIGVAVRCR